MQVKFQRTAPASFLLKLNYFFTLLAGERANSGVHRGQVLPGQVQDEAALPAPAVSSGGPGAQAHLPSSGGLHHRSG